MPEELALAQPVDHAAAVEQLDRAAAHHAHLADGLLALADDHRAGGEALDLDAVGEALELRRLEGAEHLVDAQEGADVVGKRLHGGSTLRPTGAANYGRMQVRRPDGLVAPAA